MYFKFSIMQLRRDMIIGEIVGMFPEATDIMLSYGLHCVGCHVNMYETLEQGMMGHGFTEEQLNDLLEELNDCWDEVYGEGSKKEKKIHPDADKMDCTVTPIAIEKIISVAASEKKDDWPLRIKAKPGPQDKVRFGMDFEKESSGDDVVLKKKDGKNEVTIILSKLNYDKLNGITIDYVKTEDGEGFKITSKTS